MENWRKTIRAANRSTRTPDNGAVLNELIRSIVCSVCEWVSLEFLQYLIMPAYTPFALLL